MTLAAASPVVNYIGNGSASAFSFPFPTFSQNDLVVTAIGPVTYVLTIGVDYTVSGLNVAGSPPSVTGLVTLVNSGQAWLTGGKLSSGFTLSIQRVVSLEQGTSLRNQGPYYPETIEDALDYIVMALQQQQMGGYLLADLVNGHTYRLIMVNGVLSQVQVS